MTDLDDLSWDLLQPGVIDVPHLPAPDLPGAPVQALLLLPLLAAGLGATRLGRASRLAAWIAVGTAILTWCVATWQLYTLTQGGGERTAPTVGPLPMGALEVPLTLHVGWSMAIVAWAVASVAVVVQIFARWYLWHDPRYRVFATTVSLFVAAMMATVLAGDLLVMLVGWEVMGWCSYLLIGHHSRRAASRRAASKALLVTRTADVGLVLGVVSLAAGAGTTSIQGVLEHWEGAFASGGLGGGLTAAMVLIVLGVAGKSALFPFQDWLPDAMEGPTPASALIHAATMVAAGTVVLVHLFPLLYVTDPARLLLAVLATVTMLGAALLAFAQADLKRLLAWSTVSQVALMLATLAAATPATGPDAAVQHLVAHAWFKALLFLSVGWLAVLVGGTAMAQVVSSVSRYRVLRHRLGIGLLALAGVPPLSGFVTKELAMSTAETGVVAHGGLPSLLVLAGIGAAAPLTAAYCTRAWLVLSRATPVQEHARDFEQPAVRRIDDFFDEPQVVQEAEGSERAEAAISSSARFGTTLLAMMAAAGGLLSLLPSWRNDLHLDLRLLGATLALMAVAAIVVWAGSRGVRTRDAAARIPTRWALAAERGLGFDYLYRLLVGAPVMALARAVHRYDREVLDGWVRGAGAGARLLGRAGSLTSPRRATPALALVLAAALLLALVGVVTA